MSKNLLEIFNRYEPSEEFAKILLSADADTVKLQADKPQRFIQVSAAFPRVIPKRTLYRIEAEIRQAYQLNMVRICPRYSRELFSRASIPDLLMETNRRGIVANGFFNNCRWDLSPECLTVEIPFTDSGVELIYDAKTPALMEEIIREEYGVSLKVSIRKMTDYDPSEYQSSVDSQLREMQREAAKAEVEYYRMQEAQEEASHAASAVQEEEVLPRAASVYGTIPIPEIEEGRCKIGFSTFDISSPEVLLGEPFAITPIAIAAINKPMRNIVVVGEVFNFQREASRSGDRFDISFDLSLLID